MFTGIIEEVGRVKSIRATGHAIQLQIQATQVVTDVQIGDSIAVNGVCLTVTQYHGNGFSADVVPETMRRTSFRTLQPGNPVNLERAMQMGKRFGGHIVSGHIDGSGTILSITPEDNARLFRIETSASVMKYILPKGSITIDGISLTVMDRDADSFRVSIIPHTEQVTTMGIKRAGDPVNLECDMFGKYIEQFLQYRLASSEPNAESNKNKSNLSMEFLTKHGFVD